MDLLIQFKVHINSTLNTSHLFPDNYQQRQQTILMVPQDIYIYFNIITVFLY